MVSVSMRRDHAPRHLKQHHDSPLQQKPVTRTRMVSVKFIRRSVSELLISSVAFLCCIVFLSYVADFGPVKYSQFQTGAVVNIVFFICWRNYVALRLSRLIERYFIKANSSTGTSSNNHDSPKSGTASSKTIFVWLIQLTTCYGVSLLGICSFSLQHCFSRGLLDENSGDPYFFNLLCAECFGFCGILMSILICTDVSYFLCRKAGQLYRYGNLLPDHHLHDYKDKNETKPTANNHQQKTEEHEYWIVTCSLLLSVAVVFFGSMIALLDDPVVNRVTVNIPHLSSENDGFRIVQISDLHIGFTIGKSRCQKTVNLVNKVCDGSCNVIALTGDVVDGDPETIKSAIEPLQQLDNVPKLFVSGNHEHIHREVEHVVHVLSKLGISSLANEHVRLGHGGQVVLAGVYDKSAPHLTPHLVPNMAEAMEGTTPGEDVIVLLAHQPNHFTSASAHGVDLQLAGHTHAGQMLPFTLGAWLTNEKFAGYYPSPRIRGGSSASSVATTTTTNGAASEAATAVYVSAGTHWYGPPIRFTTHHHEITDITLRRASEESS